MKFLHKFICISLLCFIGSGCATKVLKVAVPKPVPAESIKGFVKIGKITDLRGFKRAPSDPSTPSIEGDQIDNKTLTDKSIGRMRHGLYHNALWNYTLDGGEDIYGVCRNIVSSSLLTSGYQVVVEGQQHYDTAIPVEIDIIKFWAWMQPKFNIDLHFDGEVVVRSVDPQNKLDAKGAASYLFSTSMAGGSAWTNTVNEGVKKLDSSLVEKLNTSAK